MSHIYIYIYDCCSLFLTPQIALLFPFRVRFRKPSGSFRVAGFLFSYFSPRLYSVFVPYFSFGGREGKNKQTNFPLRADGKQTLKLQTPDAYIDLRTPGVALWSAKGVSLPGPFRLPSVFLPFIPCLSNEICKGNLKANFQTAGG